MQQGAKAVLLALVIRDLFDPPTNIRIIIAVSVERHQFGVSTAPANAGTTAFSGVTKGADFAVIGRAVKEKVAYAVEEWTLPKVVIRQLAQTFKGGNIEAVVPEAVRSAFGPAAVDTGPMGIKRQEGFERIRQPCFGIARFARHRQ